MIEFFMFVAGTFVLCALSVVLLLVIMIRFGLLPGITLTGLKEGFEARRAAKKYGYDFEHKCVFDEQISKYEWPESSYGNSVVLVEMESGKTGIYHATYTVLSGNTGQKDWKFEFQGYKE